MSQARAEVDEKTQELLIARTEYNKAIMEYEVKISKIEADYKTEFLSAQEELESSNTYEVLTR